MKDGIRADATKGGIRSDGKLGGKASTASASFWGNQRAKEETRKAAGTYTGPRFSLT